MKSKITLLSFIILYSLKVSAGTFTSNGSGNWSTPGTWIVVGDADGIIDNDDDVTILNGHIVTWNSTGQARNITVNPGGTINNSSGIAVLSVFGDYIIDGTETGPGFYVFTGTGVNIGGTGTYSNNTKWSFANNRTIGANVTCVKVYWTRINNGITVTNLGNITLASLISSSGLGFWVNGNNSFLTLTTDNITVNINANSFPNTVIIKPKNATFDIPVSLNTFYHLIIPSIQYNVLQLANVTVNGDFTVQFSGDYFMNGFNLNVKGNFSNNGNFVQTVGTTITLDGTSAQTFQTNRNPFALQNLVINNPSGVTIGGTGTFTIAESLTVQAGNLNLGTSKVTLLSTAAKTAYIGESAGTFSGTMTIQRFISARADGYSDMSSPVSGATFAQLDDDIEMLFVTSVPNQSSPSAYGYNETSGYFDIDQTSDPINPGEGYEVYLDNDGSNATSWNATTIDFLGTPNRGDITFPATVFNDGFNLLGNPYASFISFATFRTNSGISMQNYFQVYDETILDFTTLAGTENIAPGQGFWIEATSAGSATFRENNKIISTSSTYRSMTINENLFALRVSTPSVTNRSHTYIRFDDAAAEYYESGQDISFLKVPAPNAPSLYTLSSDQKKLRINEMKGKEEMAIPVYFKAGVDARYTLSSLNIESAELEGYKKFILEDKKLGIFHDLKSGDYSFLGETNENTDRFILHLYKNESQELLSTNSLSEISFTQSLEGTFVNFNLPETKNATISLFDILGKELISTRSLTTSTSRENIILPASFSGVYFIQVVIEDKIFTQRFFKTL